MRKIAVGRGGLFTLVDDADYKKLSRYTWSLRKHTPYLFYVYRYIRKTRKKSVQKKVRMHNDIMHPPQGVTVDHINGDALDNQRNNLRYATQRQQAQNMHLRTLTHKTSKYKGVSFCPLIHKKYKSRQPWRVRIRVNGSLIGIGYFKREQVAARAYNAAAQKYFGEFASLNKI